MSLFGIKKDKTGGGQLTPVGGTMIVDLGTIDITRFQYGFTVYDKGDGKEVFDHFKNGGDVVFKWLNQDMAGLSNVECEYSKVIYANYEGSGSSFKIYAPLNVDGGYELFTVDYYAD